MKMMMILPFILIKKTIKKMIIIQYVVWLKDLERANSGLIRLQIFQHFRLSIV